VLGGLLAACGEDDDGPTATSAAPATTPTPDGAGEPTATGAGGEPSPTSPAGLEDNPRLMGLDLEPAASEGGILIQAVSGVGNDDLQSVNPLIDYESPLVSCIFERLIDINPSTLEPVGNLAVSWESSDDGLQWVLNLRDGVSWHDGEPFTAEDVAFTYAMNLDPDTNAPDTSYLEAVIDGVEAVDEMAVAFNLSTVSVDFLADYVYWYPMVAGHILGEIAPADMAGHPSSTGEDPALVIGTGPFKFQEWVPGDHQSAVRNDAYWDGVPHLDEYVNRFVADRVAAITLLQTGEIDVATVDPASIGDFEDGPYTVIVTEYTGGLQALAMNLRPEITPLFEDVRVRQALYYAIDVPAAIEASNFGYGTLARSFLPETHWAFNAGDIAVSYDYDLDQAAALLEEAGWLPGPDGVREKDGERLSFRITVESGNSLNELLAQVIQEFWRAAGVETEVTALETTVFNETVVENADFDVAFFDLYTGFTGEQGYLFACEDNRVGYCNEEIDELYATARAEPDPEQRAELYREAQNILMDELPFIPLFFAQAVTVTSDRVHNYYPNTFAYPFNAETWWVSE
jgi:peptide/nickel transport system substrate-binding protein